MKVRFWGTRGSLATPGPETEHYGGNTSCVSVIGAQGTVLVLDAGTGIRRLGTTFDRALRRIDLLLTHLHMDHIQGLGFFAPLFNPNMEVHIWGPASTTLSLEARLSRYLSPPLFPVLLRELPCKLELHEVPCAPYEIGEFSVQCGLVCHPGPTVGFRIASQYASVAYLPDHEPALGLSDGQFPISPDWTSGYALAAGVDVLIHDAQYTSAEYSAHVGWGHSSLEQALKFAALAKVKHLVLFHHDPAHDDTALDRLVAEVTASEKPPFSVSIAAEGSMFELP
jgi:phosphoribosyl 1,2-cyclic phosphodiesterase